MQEVPQPSSSGQQIEISSSPIPLTVHYAPRTVMMHSLTETELDGVASIHNSVHLTFFGVCVGGLMAFGIALATLSIADPKTYAAFVALFAICILGSSYFGVRGVIDYREARRRLREIKAGRQC
jgi:hypothetical protein